MFNYSPIQTWVMTDLFCLCVYFKISQLHKTSPLKLMNENNSKEQQVMLLNLYSEHSLYIKHLMKRVADGTVKIRELLQKSLVFKIKTIWSNS